MRQATGGIAGWNNDQNLKTQDNRARRMDDAEDIGFHPERMADVLKQVLNHEKVEKVLKDLQEMSPEDVDGYFWEQYLANCLMGVLLLTGAGVRPHVIARMQVQEFLAATPDEEGTMVVKVKNHKVYKHHGPCLVPFVVPGLYEAAKKFLNTFRYILYLPISYLTCNLFRDPNDATGLLFATENNTEIEMKRAHNWLKEKVLKDICTKKELENLKPNDWRHAWSNWGQEHEDPEINRIAYKAMCHSQVGLL